MTCYLWDFFDTLRGSFPTGKEPLLLFLTSGGFLRKRVQYFRNIIWVSPGTEPLPLPGTPLEEENYG